ncbi:hypothetical protein BC828DRAFT_392400 [Blastocladiella britannica]|nr:hypothetical protein BC828DRAFT_392400 [Blastocladiella britannica]
MDSNGNSSLVLDDHDDFTRDPPSSAPGSPTTARLAAISRDLLAREEQYKQRDSDIANRARSVLASTQAAVREGQHWIDAEIGSADSAGATDAPSEAMRRMMEMMDGPFEATAETFVTAAAPTKPSAPSRRAIRSAPVARKLLPGSEGIAARPSPSLRAPAAAELDLIQRIADRLQDVANDPSHDYTLEATNRYLKARLLVVEEELEKVSAEGHARTNKDSAAQAQLKALEAGHKKLQKQHQVLQSAHEKQTAALTTAESRASAAETAAANLQREMQTLKKSERHGSSDGHQKDLKLNRAMEEAERLRAMLSKLEGERKEQVGTLKRANERAAAEVKRLEKQKAELMAGFKKQAALIDVLRRQKMHMEAAKLLSFTEEEFTKLLDWY